MGKKILFAIIPLILSIGIITDIPFVYADYIDDPAYNPSGCQTGNCRALIALTILP